MSDVEERKPSELKKVSVAATLGFGADDSDSYSDEELEIPAASDSDNEDVPALKRGHFDAFNAEEDDLSENEALEDAPKEAKDRKSKKIKSLTPEKVAKLEKKLAKTGVVYISKVPPYMKPSKMRQILGRFGEIDRLFLKPENLKSYARRVKYGGNKKKSFTEGWAEFTKKRHAKLAVHTLNGNPTGEKKGSFYHDDVLNIKYLSGFKWADLTEQIARENEIRDAKLQAELAQQQKLNKTFVANVEKSKMIDNIQKKKKARADADPVLKGTAGNQGVDTTIRRTFRQSKVASSRADAEQKFKTENSSKLNGVINRFI
ncbi:hypothetical protein BABINDRAFT_159437 [Babjeviella inositovora NRRL Y-12698]|uniref:Pre-rRNA-processing protein ESF2 n=1 Tax=Babjeviella inositovora NRRL Y-12698 TaxID=984486 RepID=A0A1E3QZ66_9ASCO|nr:uncharacterized protein BABINDRAFT_159437 [Babjeviella inositovora NRRL Y-12698]ODQ82960.1 hypothetical protein BABINDRAFT_159437 [Babjeviella inositovora NRRL Y-12698]